MGMAAEGQGRSTSSTDSVTGTFVNTMFRLLRTCVVVKGDAAHSASQVTRSAFIVRSLLSIGMQVRIRTNSLEFELAPNSHEFVDRSELEFATSNSNPP